MRGPAEGGGHTTDPAGRVPSPARRLLFALATLVLLCGVCAPFFTDLVDHDAPRAQGGVVDYARYGPLNGPAGLAGDWRLVWLSAGPGQPPAGTTGLVHVAGPWAKTRIAGHVLPARGAVAYQLTLRGLRPGRYILHVPTLYEASRVRVDGRVMSERGRFGLTAATSRAQVRSHDVFIDADGRDIEIAVELASFEHRDNGMESAPAVGLAEPMQRWAALGWMRGFLFVAAALMLASYGLVVFLFRRQDRTSLYIALAALSLLPIATIFSHDNLLLIALPHLSLLQMLALQYLSGIAAIGFFLAYTHYLFPRESNQQVFLLFQTIYALAFVGHAAVLARGDTLFASQMSFWVLPLRVATFAYIVGVVLTAAWRGRDNAPVFLLGTSVFAGTLVTYDLLTNGLITQDRVGIDLPAIGMLVMLFSHLVILAERWTLSLSAAQQTNDDLRRLLDVNAAITSEIELETLLRKIVQVTSRLIQADRSSLFLLDQRTDQLVSLVAEGLDAREIRIPANRGLAGACFVTGEPMNIRDAYADPRFHRDVDEITGYRTSSVLIVPVTARDGRRLGVMQALNRQGRPTFGDADLERLAAFAAQAAIAIDNATLFSEVESERSYNDSILRSMSAGVVTLDSDMRVAKLNAAACRILGVPGERGQVEDAVALLSETNPALLDEIGVVARSGQPKTLLDFDLATAEGETISANLSIVPLVGEAASAGVLVLIEDITAGKRLEGAMRRFMTQEVVDQVLAHDEVLFGDACRASVLFADIRNFTSLAEALSPRETVEMLNGIYSELFEAVAAEDGMLDKFLGDAIMAHWGAPIASERDPENAVAAALHMQRRIAELNDRRTAGGFAPLGLGVGVATGEVVAGAVGSPKRMDYTVIGDSVNLAARLQEVTKVYRVGVVACETTAEALDGHHLAVRELDVIRVRGRRRPARIFEVREGPKGLSWVAYALGRQRLGERRWREAVLAFEDAVAADPADLAAALMLDRARVLETDPPDVDWDGVWDSDEG